MIYLDDYDKFIELNLKTLTIVEYSWAPYILEMLRKLNGHIVIISYESVENTQDRVISEISQQPLGYYRVYRF